MLFVLPRLWLYYGVSIIYACRACKSCLITTLNSPFKYDTRKSKQLNGSVESFINLSQIVVFQHRLDRAPFPVPCYGSFKLFDYGQYLLSLTLAHGNALTEAFAIRCPLIRGLKLCKFLDMLIKYIEILQKIYEVSRSISYAVIELFELLYALRYLNSKRRNTGTGRHEPDGLGHILFPADLVVWLD